MREGHEFTLQRELPEEMRARPVRRPVMGANLQRLVREIVREMLLMELSGHVPGNRACSEQPWWRVRMWEAFWRGRIEAAHSRAMIADSR